MKIRRKIILGYMAIVLLMCIVGYFSVYISKKILIKTIGEYTVAMANTALDKIDRAIQRRSEQVEAYTENLPFKEMLTQSNEEFDRLDNVQEYISQKDKEWTSVPKKEITAFMQTLIDNKLSEELRQKIELKKFFKAQYGYDVFAEVFITNKYGASVAQSQKTTDYYQADEQWWQEAKKNGTYLTDVEYDKSSDVYSIAICRRIDDENGKFIGVLKAVFNIKEIIDILEETAAATAYKAEEYNLFTKNGGIIYSTGERYSVLSQKQLSDFHSEDEKISYFIAAGDAPGKGRKLFTHVHSKGYKNYKGLGWVLLVEHDVKEIFAPIFWLTNRLLAAIGIIATLTIVISFLISKRITGPIVKLCTAASCIGQGDLDAKIEVKSNDEIGQLAVSFNKMVDNLKKISISLNTLNHEITERKPAESMVIASELRYRRLFETAKDGILIINFETGIILDVNPFLIDLLGYSKADFLKKYLWEVGIFKDIAASKDNFLTLQKKRCVRFEDLPLETKEGKKIDVEFVVNTYDIGRETVIQCNIRNITERKQAEDLLRESEDRYRSLFVSSSDAIMTLEPPTWGFTSGNPATVKMFKVKNEAEFLTYEPWKLSPEYQPDGRASDEKAKEMIGTAMRKGLHFFEWTHKRANGEEFLADVLLSRVEQGEKIFLHAIVRDITERKKKDKLLLDTNNRLQETSQNLFNAKKELEKKNAALRESHEVLEKQVEERTSELTDANKTLQNAETNLRMMINQNADGILIIDHKGIIRFVNSTAESLFGRKKEELIGETFGFAAVKDETIEIEVIQKRGEVVTAEMRTVEIKWEGEMVYLASLRNITERKETEEKLKETMKIKSQFISTVSHELRTPLTAIKEGIALVLDGLTGDINEEQKEVLGISKKNADRLARLINNVLDFDKLKSGKMKLDIQPNNINKIVRDVYEIFALTAKDTGINLLLELDGSLPEIGFDNDKITQVLTNLISNAMNFTKKGNIVIKTSKNDGTIHVSVSDTGCGIKIKDLTRVFDRFEQVATGGERKTGGTGLGLSISKEIIEQHNGELWLESKFGKGSKFTFTLPIYSIEEPFKKYVNDGIKEASRNNTKLSLVLISIADFDKLEQKLPHEKITSALKDMEAIIENDLRRGKSKPNQVTDTVFRFSNEIFIVLTNCGKENIPGVKERLEQKLDDYLADQNLADKIRLLFGCAAYPDDAGTNEDLIMKVRQLQATAPVASSV